MNLRNKSYCIFNVQYSKEEYEQKKKELRLSAFNALCELRERAENFWKDHPVRYYHGMNNDDISGDNISYSKNAHMCFDVVGAEDSSYCQILHQKSTKSSYDYAIWGHNSELMYESIEVGSGAYNTRFAVASDIGLTEASYTLNCSSSSNLFGCINLRNSSYCIFNKQYSKEEYEQLVPRIIEQMNVMPYKDMKGRAYAFGEFFPIELSPFAYNETIAQEYFPLSTQEAQANGHRWLEPMKRLSGYTLKGANLDDEISDIQDTIIKEIIACAHNQECNDQCTGAYKITHLELEFYRRLALPLPRLCSNCRHNKRIANRNPLRLWQRTCQNPMGCGSSFETSYAPDRVEKVYCETCYQKEII